MIVVVGKNTLNDSIASLFLFPFLWIVFALFVEVIWLPSWISLLRPDGVLIFCSVLFLLKRPLPMFVVWLFSCRHCMVLVSDRAVAKVFSAGRICWKVGKSMLKSVEPVDQMTRNNFIKFLSLGFVCSKQFLPSLSRCLDSSNNSHD